MIGALVAAALILLSLTLLALVTSALTGARVGLGRSVESALVLFYLLQRSAVSFFQNSSGTAAFAPLAGLLLVGLALALGGFLAARLRGGARRRQILAGAACAAPYAGLALLVPLAFGLHYSAGIGESSVAVRPAFTGALVFPLMWGLLFGTAGASMAAYGKGWFRPTGGLAHRFASWTAPVRGALSGLKVGLFCLAGASLIVAGALALAHPQEAASIVASPERALKALLAAIVFLPNLLAAAFLGALGVPFDWELSVLSANVGSAGVFGGALPSSSGAAALPTYASVALLLPLIVTLRMGWVAARSADKGAQGRLLAGLTSAVPFAVTCWVLALFASGGFKAGGLLTLRLEPSLLATVLLPLVWGALGGWLGALVYLWRAGLARPREAIRLAWLRLPRPSLSGALAPHRGMLALLALPLPLLMLAIAGPGSGGASKPPPELEGKELDREGLKRLQEDALGELNVTPISWLGTPGFISGHLPLRRAGIDPQAKAREKAQAIVTRYRDLFGIGGAEDLKYVSTEVDRLGMAHVAFDQLFKGVPIEGSSISVHFDRTGKEVRAISSGLVPDLRLKDVEPHISSAVALATARKALPKGRLQEKPQLVVYPGIGAGPSGTDAILAWIVWLAYEQGPGSKTRPVSNTYAIDAESGQIVDVLSNVLEARQRMIWDSENTNEFFVRLGRQEGYPPTGDVDVDQAYDFSGDFYDYFADRARWIPPLSPRDSYDGRGTTMHANVRYGPPGGRYSDFFLQPNPNPPPEPRQVLLTLFSDGFAVKDIVAHEWTHAMIARSARLQYRWQSGALNESFADIFASNIDREDWLIGEDLPGGFIRDMSDPTRSQPAQPDHMRNWRPTCQDNYGVHANSGILNKAYYLTVAGPNRTTRLRAERIYLRALITYLDGMETATMNQAAAALRASARELYGPQSSALRAVDEALKAVGLTDPPTYEPGSLAYIQRLCEGPCAPTGAIAGGGLSEDGPSAVEVLATLYRTRDELAQETPAGEYYMPLYERYLSRIGEILGRDQGLRQESARLLQRGTPAMTKLMNGDGDTVVSQDLVDDVEGTLLKLAEDDRATGDGALAALIERELKLVDLEHFVGMTFEEAWKGLNDLVERSGEKK